MKQIAWRNFGNEVSKIGIKEGSLGVRGLSSWKFYLSTGMS
jgi:hypothetical protein